jgi:hypothetical protein
LEEAHLSAKMPVTLERKLAYVSTHHLAVYICFFLQVIETDKQ